MDKLEFDYLGPYKIEGVLGRGGMGTVYKGVHSKSGEQVAVKVITPGVANQMRFRRRFAAEVETLKRLLHPNIVRLVGFGEEQGLLFYSMEYVVGHSLLEHLRQFHRLDWMEVIQVGIEVSSALKHAHDQGIIHRDLKPANLLLTKDGHVKLTDFGIAKLFGSTEMTAVGSVLGTADFMPPEQAEGKSATVRSDLYSLGSVLYALLVGRAPFAGKSVPEVLYAVRYTQAPDSTFAAPDAPPELHALISELLEKDPLKRPPTALVVGNRLKSMQQGVAKLESDRARTQIAPVEPLNDRAIGKELTSIDLNDEHDDDLRATGHSVTQERPTAIASESLMERLGQQPIGLNNKRDPNSGLSVEIAGAVDSYDDALPSTDQALPSKATHYTQVSDADAKKFTLGSTAPEPVHGFDWTYYGSIAAMVVLLIAAVLGMFYLLQPATADQLHATIVAAVESGDDSQLSDSAETLEEFVERFPNDPRSEEVRQLINEVALLRATRMLQRQARNGLQNMSAVEQGFLACVEALGRDQADGQKKFNAFLAVYDSASTLSTRDKRLVELARYATKSMVPTRTATLPTAASELEKVIRSAEASLPPAQLPNFYRSLVEVYGDKPWAQDSLNRIRGLISESK
ncbi:MAG: serine/threonine protein kinase [Pirellulaceae bacterium]|nr:serine/threonine protein kinase [Pirellulaceae bacterium]